MKWITDRNPTPEEVKEAGDTGFIVCISGHHGWSDYDHTVDMIENTFERGEWYIHGFKTQGLTVHGWMLPPKWEG